MTAARKLRPYFQAHSIEVPTNHPLRQVLQKPEVSEQLTKWVIELSEYDITFCSRTIVKAQAVADFIAKFTYSTPISSMPKDDSPENEQESWSLYVDESSYSSGSEAGLILIALDGSQFQYALRFDFHALNNEVEYEALIVGLEIASILR